MSIHVVIFISRMEILSHVIVFFFFRRNYFTVALKEIWI